MMPDVNSETRARLHRIFCSLYLKSYFENFPGRRFTQNKFKNSFRTLEEIYMPSELLETRDRRKYQLSSYESVD
jgi:hypothetical protein